MSNQPNYDFLLKLEKWTKKDAALILCGFEPSHYKKIRFGQDNLPETLTPAAQLYRIFCSVNFLSQLWCGDVI